MHGWMGRTHTFKICDNQTTHAHTFNRFDIQAT